MTAKAIGAVLIMVMAAAWTSVAFAADNGYGASQTSASSAGTPASNTYAQPNPNGEQDNTMAAPNGGYTTAGKATAVFNGTTSNAQWSGRYIDGEWTPGVMVNGTWRAAYLEGNTWTANVYSSGSWQPYTLSMSDWNAMPQGRVAGYTSNMHGNVYQKGDYNKDDDNDRDNDNDNDYDEGAKCDMGGHGGYTRGGCGTCGDGCGCSCPGAAYDCWGVWPGDENNFEAIRDSDYDPVMGSGDYGHSFFGWSGW